MKEKEGSSVGKIQDAIGKLESDEEKFGVRMVLAAFEDFDKELADIARKIPKAHNPGIHALKARLANLVSNTNSAVSRFQNIQSSLSRQGWAILGMIWNWFTGNLIKILASIGSQIGVTGWSVGTTSGFPVGISASLTLHFKVAS